MPPGDGFRLTGPYKNWDGRRAECHATGHTGNHSPATYSFALQMAEIGIDCETCHGQGEANFAWAADPDFFTLATELTLPLTSFYTRNAYFCQCDQAGLPSSSTSLGHCRQVPLAARGLGSGVHRKTPPAELAPSRRSPSVMSKSASRILYALLQ